MILFLLLFIPIFSIAQNYKPDKIFINGKNYDCGYHLLKTYFKKNPDKLPQGISLDYKLDDRGFQAQYIIENDKLYLTDILIAENTSNSQPRFKSIGIDNLLGNNNSNNKLLLDWISGLFDVGTGSIVIDKHKPSDYPKYTEYLVFEVDKGQIIGFTKFNLKQITRFKTYQWDIFHRTENYSKTIQYLIQNGMTEQEAKQHIYENILFYSKKNLLLK